MPLAELVARKILRRAMVEPGTPPTEIARALGIHVSVRDNLGPDVRGCIDPFLRSILIAPSMHATRFQWVTGHELAELELAEHTGDQHEDLCQGVAAALLMPAEMFMASAESCGWNLAALRRWWPHCSWQALARRVVELRPGVAASAWIGPSFRFREWHEGYELPPESEPLEAFVAAESVASQRDSAIILGGLRVRAWATGQDRAVALAEAA